MSNVVAKTLEDLKNIGALTGVDVANVANVSKATVSRWTSGAAMPQTSTQLVLSDLRYVVDKLAEFYSPSEARTWLYARNSTLGGRSAIELIHEGKAEAVLDAIESLANLTYI